MRFGLISVCVLATLTAASAEEFPLSTRVCIVPVANGVATEADVGDAWRMVSHAFDIPGLPGPVFTPTNREGEWTIIDRTYQPYEGPFPTTFFDGGNWVQEPWSEVVIATREEPHGQERGVWIVAPGDSAFVSIKLPDEMKGGISQPFLLPRQQQTVVLIGGLPFVVQAEGLKPWITVEQMTAAHLPGLQSLHYSEAIQAIVAEDSDGWIHVLPDDGDWQRLNRATDDGTYVVGLFDIDGRDATLLRGSTFVDIIRRRVDTGAFEMERIASQSLLNSDLTASFELGQALRYTSGGLFDSEHRWFRRNAFGYEEIPGGRIELPDDTNAIRLQDLDGTGRAMIAAKDAMYLYDGSAMTVILDQTGQPLSGPAYARGFPAINRILLMKDQQLYDLSSEGRATRLSHMPNGVGLFDLVTWESVGVVLASGEDGVFSIDQDLAVERVPGPNFRLGVPITGGNISATGDILLTGADRLMLGVNAQRHPQACGSAL